MLSWDLAREIAEVFRRPRLRRFGVTERDVRDVLALLAPFLPTAEAREAIVLERSPRDVSDVPVVRAALEGRAEAIVTGDDDLLDDRRLSGWLRERGIVVLTPAELARRLEA